MKITTLLIVFLVFISCTKKVTVSPEQALANVENTIRSFIDLSSGSKELGDRKKLQRLCVGELRRAFDRMTDDMFKISYIDSNIQIQKLDIVDTKVEKDAAKVKYRISIENRQGTDPTREINEREVELVRSQGVWYIDSIRLSGSDQVAFTRGMIF